MISSLVEFLPIIMIIVLGLLIFSGFPVGMVLAGVAVLFGLIGSVFGSFSLIEFYNIMPRIWGGSAENLILVAVPMFIFMGVMLERSGVAETLLQDLQLLLRSVPGGLALAVTLLGTVMAAATGIIGASVIMLSVLALPVMMKHNYSKELATGTVAAAGTLGILLPPSIMLVIMADLLSISVGRLFYGAVIPGLLLSAMYAAYIMIYSKLQPEAAPPVSDADHDLPLSVVIKRVSRSLLPPLFLIGLVLGSIFAGWATPTEAAGVGAFGTILLALYNKRLSMKVLKHVTSEAGATIAMVFMVIIGATAFAYVFRALGGDFLVLDAIEYLDLSSWAFLIALLLLVFILGFFFDWLEIVLIVLPIFVPAMLVLDFGSHVDSRGIIYWFAILVAVNLQTSFLTPPFGFALFFMKGVAPEQITLNQIYRGVIPFVLIQLFGLFLVLMFPSLTLWLPSQMLR